MAILVLFEHEGVDFLVRAKPIGRNGYHVGKVVYAELKDAPYAPVPASAPVPTVATPAPAALNGPQRSRIPGKTLADARKSKNLATWDATAKEFWNWLRDKKKRQGLVSPLFKEFREGQSLRADSTLAFHVIAAGERHDMWRITSNKAGSRFTMTVVD